MKMLSKTLCLALPILFVISCKAPVNGQGQEEEIKDQAATVKVYVASRGVYQYLLEMTLADGQQMHCWPEPLPEEMKADGKSVMVSGTLLKETVMVKKPGPTDQPEDDFAVRKLLISSITEN